MRIRVHLSLIIAAALLPVIVFSGLAVNLLQEAAKESALRTLHEIARATALSVDRELASAEAALQVLGTSDMLVDGDYAGFYQQSKSADRGYGAWTALFDEHGKQLSNTLFPLNTPLPDANADLRINDVLSGQRTLVSNLFTGTLTKRFVTTLNRPVETTSGKRFVVSEVFGAEFFATALAESKIPASWTIAILDGEGRFIARTRAPEKMVGKPARPELVAAAKQRSSGYLRHNTWEGTESFDVFTHSQISGWTIAVAAPVEAIESTVQHAVLLAGLGLLAAIAAAAAVAALFSRHLVHSIDAIDKAAVALVKGRPLPEVKSGLEEIRQLNRSLADAGALLEEERASRHAAEMERERLLGDAQAARVSAEAENLAKDKFLAMLGHELRNPLSAISGAIALTRASHVTPASRAHAEAVIARQSAHLGHIVDDLLDHSRVTMGKIRLVSTPLDLAKVVDSCMDALRATRRAGSADIRVATGTAWINGDVSRLEQIVSNLVGNALKFTPEGGRIDVTVAQEAGRAVLRVRDNGNGIPEELMPRLFEPFVQGEPPRNAQTTMHGGLGIGLNLVRQLVELHGGTVAVASEGEGAGATFTVSFPLCTMPAAAPAAASAGAAPVSGLVLLIEDNDDAREMMAALLEVSGLRVIEARNGREGIEKARLHRPQIGIVDIGLPDMPGYEVAALLRGDEATKDMLLVALTGYGQAEDVRRALGAGFNLHFAKPIEFDALMAALAPTLAV